MVCLGLGPVELRLVAQPAAAPHQHSPRHPVRGKGQFQVNKVLYWSRIYEEPVRTTFIAHGKF
jgi:hypothetical protein